MADKTVIRADRRMRHVLPVRSHGALVHDARRICTPGRTNIVSAAGTLAAYGWVMADSSTSGKTSDAAALRVAAERSPGVG